MAIFGVDVSKDKATAKEFIKETNQRLSNNSMVQNPFTGKLTYFEKGLVVVDLKPIYPNVSHLGWLVVIATMVFNLPLYSLAGTIPFMLVGFTFSGDFFYLVFKAGLKKKGFKGKPKKLKPVNLIEFLTYKRWDYVSK